jgi:hypothetical protein
MSDQAAGRTVVFSGTLGLMPCEILGRNEAHYLVRVMGMPKPMSVPRALVFELEQGWELQGGRLVGPSGGAALATCPSTAGAD